ncbi:hypothetical protein OAO83_03805 [Amylibacter sp.]|nr:hypothetical protein [Amylibacter sp.]
MFSYLEPRSQSMTTAILAYRVTNYAMIGSFTGFLFSDQLFVRHRKYNWEFHVQQNSEKIRNYFTLDIWKTSTLIFLFFIILAGSYFQKAYGYNVFQGAYGEEDGGKGVTLGSMTIIGSLGIFILTYMTVSSQMKFARPILFVMFVFYVIYSQILLGLRQDAISIMLGMFAIYKIVRTGNLQFSLKYLLPALVFYFFFEVWGVARTALSSGGSLVDMITYTFTRFDANVGIKFGTISPISTTFSNALYLIQGDYVQYSYGATYLDWLLRIPPQFIYEDRPRAMAWLFAEHDLLSAGGFFELGEAYLNLGLAGAFVFPMIISFSLGQITNTFMYRPTYLNFLIFSGILSVFLRGHWYQTFAFFRALTVVIALFILFRFLQHFLRR